MSEKYVRFAEEGNLGCLTLFSLGAMTGSSMQNASSISMGWGAISDTNTVACGRCDQKGVKENGYDRADGCNALMPRLCRRKRMMH